MQTITDDQIAGFLLGQLPEARREEIEQQIFSSDDLYEKVRAIQADLTHDYVKNRLSPSRRSQFEVHLLNTQSGRVGVAFGKDLSDVISAAQPETIERSPAGFFSSLSFLFQPAYALAAAGAIVLIIAVAILAIQNRRLLQAYQLEQAKRDETERKGQIGASEDAANRRKLEDQIAELESQGSAMQKEIQDKQRQLDALNQRPQPQKPIGVVAMFSLEPGLVRGNNDEPEKLIIPSSAQTARIKLGFQKPENFASYDVEVRTARGNLVFSRNGLQVAVKHNAQSVVLGIPAKILTNGEYEITLTGVQKESRQVIGYYYFIALLR